MTPQFIFLTIFTILLHLFFMYYIMLFTIIYEKSSISWIEGALLSIFLDWFVLEIGTQIIQAGIRSIAKKYHKFITSSYNRFDRDFK